MKNNKKPFCLSESKHENVFLFVSHKSFRSGCQQSKKPFSCFLYFAFQLKKLRGKISRNRFVYSHKRQKLFQYMNNDTPVISCDFIVIFIDILRRESFKL